MDTTQEVSPEQRLGELLVRSGKLSARDFERAAAARDETGQPLEGVLVQLGLVSELDLVQARSVVLGLPFLPSDAFPESAADVPGLVPEFLVTHGCFPLRVHEGCLEVAMRAPESVFVRKALRLATGFEIRPYLALPSDIEKALTQAESGSGLDESDDSNADAGDFVEHLRDLASEAPVIRMVNAIVAKVIELRASDIHLEPFDDGLHVRYRVDGVIVAADVVPPRHGAAVSSRVKLLAHLDIAERRLPQDGRIRMRVRGRELDLRVSTVPTVHGESVVMRVLDRANVRFRLEQMGFADDTLARFNELLARPHGILLVTGPTGSGKTTTLYAALSKLDSTTQKIINVEDPVEYQLEGINQIQVHPQIGLTFAVALRSILRQDPDIIMIGEMRDGETAQIAVQSALTGHLVLSTLHTNTAAGAIIRLLDMGVESYLITSSVNGVLSQRLVRTLCDDCKSPLDLAPGAERDALSHYLPPGGVVYRAVGCPKCRHTGYLGRTGIHELMVLDDRLRRAVLDGKDQNELHALAIGNGMLTLYDDGLRKVAAGTTSLDELLRVTQDSADA